MKRTIPTSPFSTCLSGSAKETELRLRSIFQWKKKRPPVILLALAVLVALLCGSMLSCQTEQEGAVTSDDVQAKPSAAGRNELDDTPRPEEEETLGIDAETTDFPLLVPVGEEVRADLDGDGAAERVLVELRTDSRGWNRYALTINGADQAKTLERLGVYIDNPDVEHYALTDLDAGDGVLEIALPDEGPSNDPRTCFLRYDGGTLSSLGEVYGMVSADHLTFDGAGVVSSFMRLSVLQTWYAPVRWRIGADGVFASIPQELYTPLHADERPKTALLELAAYADKDLSSERTRVSAGTQMTLLGTDNLRWVLCADESGERFWLHLDEETGHQVELYDTDSGGGYGFSWEALDGLSMAD